MIFSCFYFLFSLISNRFSFFCFSQNFANGEYIHLACPITRLRFADSLLITYSSFPSLILSSVVMISFYFLRKRFFLKRERLSDPRLASISKKEKCFAVHLLERFMQSLQSISAECLNAYLLKFLFVWNFHYKVVRRY